MPTKPETILKKIESLPDHQSKLCLKFKDWLEYENDNSERNWINYFKILSLFANHIGNARFEDVTREDILSFLDKTKEMPNKMSIEKLIYEIDCKISQIFQKLSESTIRTYDYTINSLNNYLKSKNRDERYFTFRDKIGVSEKAYEKIEKIISEDENHLWSRQN